MHWPSFDLRSRYRGGSRGLDAAPQRALRGDQHRIRIDLEGRDRQSIGRDVRLEHMSIRLSVTRVCKVSFTFAFGYRFEKRGYGFPKPLDGARLCFA